MCLSKYARRHWLAKLSLPFSIQVYHYAYGNSLGTITYVWKVPEGPVDHSAVASIFSELTSMQVKYSTRAMRRDFLQKYSQRVSIPKCLLRNMYRTLLNDGSAAITSDQAAVDERVAQALLEVDDPDIIIDLRRLMEKLIIVGLTPFGMNYRHFWMRKY